MHLFDILLVTHIAGGGISLLLGLYVLLAKKGGKRHKLIGNIYFFALLTASLVALPMSYMHPNYFLFIIGVFTSYMLLSGRRSIHKKSITDVSWVDWTISLLMLVFGIGFIGLGAYYLYHGVFFGVVLLVFGSISLLFVVQDYVNFKGKAAYKNNWLATHLQRMIGSYIASVTAFLVVNNKVLPGIVVWLLPTLLLTPLIIVWGRKYRGKKNITVVSAL